MGAEEKVSELVSLREINQKTSQVIRSVTGGREVLVTERGRPRWRITPVEDSAAGTDATPPAGAGEARPDWAWPTQDGVLMVAPPENPGVIPRIFTTPESSIADILDDLRSDA